MNQPAPINRIAFITPGGRLATVAPDGSAPRVLSAPGSQYQFPAWSPDGSAIAVTGGSRSSAGVLVFHDIPLGGALPRVLYSSPAQPPIYLCWHPGGTAVSFIAAHPQGMALYLAALSGDDIRQLATGQPCFWDWSPDGERAIVHTHCFSPAARLDLVDRYGTAVPAIETRPGRFQSPAFAANGRAWAWAEMVGESGSQVVIIREGADPFAFPHNGLVALAWSPTISRLAFTCPPITANTWYGQLCLVTPGLTLAHVLTEDPILAFFWAPDGRSIAYIALAPGTQTAGSSGAGDSPARNGRPQAATPPARLTSIALDLGVVNVDTRRCRTLTRFTPQPPFINQFLPFFDQYARSHQLWSPDSRALAVPAVVAGSPRVLVVPIDGGAPAMVAEGGMPCWSPR